MAGGGTDVLEGDVERTDIFEKGLLGDGGTGQVDGQAEVRGDHAGTQASRPADTLPVPRDEKKFDDDPARGEAHVTEVPADEVPAHEAPVEEPGVSEPAGLVEGVTQEAAVEEAAVQEAAAPPKGKRRDSQFWTARLSMMLVAVVALAGLMALAVAIAREVNSANASDDIGDLGYGYTCDRVSGSDPGVYGVGNCHAAGGMQASGVIPVGQSYVLTPRKANALGYTQTFSCSGGRADSPSMVVPRRCAPIGNPVMASR